MTKEEFLDLEPDSMERRGKYVANEYKRWKFKLQVTGRKAAAIRRWIIEEEMHPVSLLMVLADWAMRQGWEVEDVVLDNEVHQARAEKVKQYMELATYLRYQVVPRVCELLPKPQVLKIGGRSEIQDETDTDGRAISDATPGL